MSWRDYSNGAENLSKQLESAYSMIGGSFLFLWVQDVPTFTLSYAATAHFTPALAGKAAKPIMDFFYESMKHIIQTGSGVNLWCTAGKRSKRKMITTAPENYKSEKMATTIKSQRDLIMRMVDELKSQKLPFIFLYKLPTRSAADRPQVIKEVFSFANPRHQEILVESDGWGQILTASDRALTAPISEFLPKQGSAKRQKQRAPRGDNQSTRGQGSSTCNTKGTLGVHAYSITKTVLKDWLGYNHMETAKAAKINLLPVDKFRIFFRKYVLKEEEEADVVETENREEVAPQEEGDAAIEAQEEGSGEDEDGYGQGEEDLFTVDADPIFNSSTGCLSWMLKDVSSDGEVEEANADEQLLQENQEVGNASLNTSIFPR